MVFGGLAADLGVRACTQAAGKAINSPLLEASMDGAQGVLLSIAGGSDLGLFEIHEAATLVQEAAHAEANIIFGTVIDDSLGDEVRVTVIAAGFASGGPTHKKLDPAPVASRSVASAQAGQLGRTGQQPQQAEQVAQPGTVQPGTAQPGTAQPGTSAPPLRQAPPPPGPAERPHPGSVRPPTSRLGGMMPGRAMPVTAEDEVDVPPFMKR